MKDMNTIRFEIPSGEWRVADVVSASGSDMVDIDIATQNALMDAPNKGGWQHGRCNSWAVTMRGRSVTAHRIR